MYIPPEYSISVGEANCLSAQLLIYSCMYILPEYYDASSMYVVCVCVCVCGGGGGGGGGGLRLAVDT